MMKISRRPQLPLKATMARPRKFVARLVLADLLAKRGQGPLERKQVRYRKRPTA